MFNTRLAGPLAGTVILIVGSLAQAGAQSNAPTTPATAVGSSGDDSANQSQAASPAGPATSYFGSGSRQHKSQLHVLKLPRANLGPVPPELTRPIGIAPKNRPIVEKLQLRRLTLDVREVPLGEVVDNLRDQASVNVLLDRPSLEEEGINTDTPVTANLMDVPLGQGLTRLLEPYNLTYIVTHGVIMITSKLSAGNELTFQVYPVADLVWSEDAAGKDVFEFERLIKLIEQTVAPNSWSVVGGAGTVRPFSGSLCLAINQTQAVHDEITNVLDTLRQVRGKSDQPPPARVRELPKPAVDPVVIGIGRREDELMRRTREIMISLQFVETPLIDIVDFLRESTKLPYEIDRPSLEEEGINPDTPLSIRVETVGLDDALSLMLGQYNLTWHVKNDVIVITSRLTADNDLRALCYPVGDLVVLSDGRDRWSVYQCELLDLIQEAVSPYSWSCVGGAGTIEFFAASQCLMVSQTPGVHDQIPALLAWLRESNDRLPALTRAAGMPAPDKLAESRLLAARSADDRAAESKRIAAEQAADTARRAAEESENPDLARRRAEVELIKAQIWYTESAAAKAQAETAQIKGKPTAGIRDMTKPPGLELCPHCGKAVKE